jgi:hypothetical protein
MSTEKENKGLLTEVKNLVQSIKAKFEPDTTVKSLNLSCDDGRNLEIVTDETSPKAGNVVNIDGKPAPDGEYKISDGQTIVAAGGKITEVKAAELIVDEAAKALALENETLKAKVTELENAATLAKTNNETIKAEVDELKKLTSKYIPEGRITNLDKEIGAGKPKSTDEVKAELKSREEARKAKKK